MITDFHTHAFSDTVAGHAIKTLQSETDKATAHLDGRISSLLASMDKAGIGRSIVCPIATKPTQYAKILQWCEQIRSERIVPFPSIHPKDPDALVHIREICQAGFKGIKLHPYYQQFEVDSPDMYAIYKELCAQNLILVCHTGFDIAFPLDRVVDPARIARVVQAFPDLKFVTTHLLAWDDWDEVKRLLLGKPIYTDFSMTIPFLGAERTKAMLLKHPREYVLFGTDSPWQDQSEDLARLRALNMGSEWEQAVLVDNARRLLGE